MGIMASFWHDVADTPNGLNHIIAQLASQMVNMHFHRVAAHFGAPTVQVLFQLISGEHLPCMHHECEQEVKFTD